MNAEQFSQVADLLFQRHYGVTLNDTFVSNPDVVSECLLKGTRPFEVVNEEASDNQFTRIDLDSWLASGLISSVEEAAVLTELGIALPFAPELATPSL
jgi:hypothetical protein